MENEDNIYDQLNSLTANLFDRIGPNNTPVEFDNINNVKIEIPSLLKDVIMKIYPEIIDIKSNGYRETIMYNPEDFSQIKKYSVGVDLYFDEKNSMKKSRKEYGDIMTDYFKMTYSNLDFVSFHVRSFIIPPDKTNEEKFFEVFGV